ncbi:DUF3097 domain-containing protein [Arthrobacter glacialis]|uniref:DUF3097 domain-containing protein n=1 Tax=Arthrobacter glacialis TaxID=1664 RepID=A0A2S3ZVZ5_ARTGL|nr:DUF3097 domain-containing protein [Arthrobacter glacialis]POH58631.1 DUF3097 domain-containing protein [Arthrobacter glacialis]POH73436.1 DUF3097 domain-containing protein [Arthrobacter glacialis]
MEFNQWGPQDLSPPPARTLPKVEAVSGLVVEDQQTGWVGAVVRLEKSGGMHIVELADRREKIRAFPLGFGFLYEGAAVELIAPRVVATQQTLRTASGSVKVANSRAKVAKASRIWVEGKHDAELVEKVWGDDLRVEGIVVEPLRGIDDLAAAVADFSPGPNRRLGILVDHLVPGSKESRIVANLMKSPGTHNNVLVVGHPYVDVWQAIKPATLGIPAWPVIPRSMEWKLGILKAFGWPHSTAEDIGLGWQRLLSRVNSYADLEPSLLGRVEEVIDFLTAPVS